MTTANPPCDLDWLRSTKIAAATRNQTAQLLGVDPRTVSRAVEIGELPAVRIGGRVLIPIEHLRRILGIGASNDSSRAQDVGPP